MQYYSSITVRHHHGLAVQCLILACNSSFIRRNSIQNYIPTHVLIWIAPTKRVIFALKPDQTMRVVGCSKVMKLPYKKIPVSFVCSVTIIFQLILGKAKSGLILSDKTVSMNLNHIDFPVSYHRDTIYYQHIFIIYKVHKTWILNWLLGFSLFS